MFVSSFTVILGNNEKKVTFQVDTNSFNENLSILHTYVLNLGGMVTDNNTAHFNSADAFDEFVNRLLDF